MARFRWGWLLALSVLAAGPLKADEYFGAWQTGQTSDGTGLYAATVNDSGNLLGQYCFLSEDKCVWLVGMNVACSEGDQYAALANSNLGAQHLFLQCGPKIDELSRYLFKDFDSADELIRKARKIGIAVPLKGDRFRVLRFDLTGSSKAIAAMHATAQRWHRNRQQRHSTTDISL